MLIQLSSGIGTGPTTLAAFDAALQATGAANYNLLRLSSVIPPASIVKVKNGPVDPLPGIWGDRLYVVMAEMRVDRSGDQAWAGIGWVQNPETGQGLFVEHEGHEEARVIADIRASLTALVTSRNMEFGPIQMHVVGQVCRGEPICALAIATYQVSGWDNRAHLYPTDH